MPAIGPPAEWRQIDLDFAVFVTSRMLAVVPALWFAGWLLKQSKLPNALIPFVLAALGAVAGVLIDGPSANSVVQGILAAAAAVFGHQAVKQGTAIVARQSHDEPGPAA